MSFQDGEWEGKSIYLRKEGEKEILGLHATGMTDENGTFQAIEAWLNVYVENQFMYSVARIFEPIELVAEDYKKDGWTEYEMPEMQS